MTWEMNSQRAFLLLTRARPPCPKVRLNHGSAQRALFRTSLLSSRKDSSIPEDESDSNSTSITPRNDSNMTSDTKEGDGSQVGSTSEKHALDGRATGEQKKGVVNRVAPKTSVHKHSFSAWKFMLGLILVAYTWKYFMYNRAMQTLLDAEQRHNEQMEDMSNAERIAKRPEAFLDWQRVKRRVEEEEELQQKHSQKGET